MFYGDAFLTRLDPTGAMALYSTYVGGSEADHINGVRVDSSGNIYVAGWTRSTNFPVTSNAFRRTFAGHTDVFVAKFGAACTYSITPSSASFPASGGSGSVAVMALAGCNWSATSNVSWLTITSGSSGSGNGTVVYSEAANTDSISRTGTLTIAGQTFTVTQPPVPACAPPAEPTLRITLQPGFYITEARNAPGTSPGYWGMEVLVSRGQLSGGFNLGGAVQENAGPAAFGAFSLADTKTVRVRVDAQVVPGGAPALFSMGVRLLDQNRVQIGTEQFGTTLVQFDRTLSAGFYIIEVRTGSASPRATFQMGLSTDFFSGGVVVGGFVAPGLVGFGAFYVPEAQEVSIRIVGPSYGSAGASCMRLTLLDANRNVIRTVP